MKTKSLICCAPLVLLLFACSEPKSSAGDIDKRIGQLSSPGFEAVTEAGKKANSFSVKKPKTVSLKASHVKAYINFSEALFNSQPKLLEQIQSLVPLDLSAMTATIKSSGFSDLEEFADSNLVLAICVNSLLAAENTDRIQGKTKKEYLDDFTKDLDDGDEFDRKFKAEAEKRVNESLADLEAQGLVGNKTNRMVRFVIRDLKKKKVGEENTEVVLQHLDALKKVWVLKYQE